LSYRRLTVEQVTNTINQRETMKFAQGKLETMDVSPILAESIRRTHNGQSSPYTRKLLIATVQASPLACSSQKAELRRSKNTSKHLLHSKELCRAPRQAVSFCTSVELFRLQKMLDFLKALLTDQKL
jgi:hypothetical protein